MANIQTDLPVGVAAAPESEERYVTLQDVRALLGWSWMYAHRQQRLLFPPPHHVGGYGGRTYFWRWGDLKPIVDGILDKRREVAERRAARASLASPLRDPRYVSASALAGMAGVSRARIGQIIRSGRSGLPVKRHGRFILVPRAAAEKWLAQRQRSNELEGSDEGSSG